MFDENDARMQEAATGFARILRQAHQYTSEESEYTKGLLIGWRQSLVTQGFSFQDLDLIEHVVEALK